jgi:2-polyprenyl-3-methyl-5-hydroxy-6-metoxy-1,4-benzoquinol methylase
VEFIRRAVPEPSAFIIDVGGGESTLVDDLITPGYENVTVFDISRIAIEATQKRLGAVSGRVHWLVADITDTQLESQAYDLWHDRLYFVF